MILEFKVNLSFVVKSADYFIHLGMLYQLVILQKY